MNFNYIDNIDENNKQKEETYEELKERILSWVNQFEENSKKFEEEFKNEIDELEGQLKECKECKEPKTCTYKIEWFTPEDESSEMIDDSDYDDYDDDDCNDDDSMFVDGGCYCALDDHDMWMLGELADKMNCSWEYVMTEAVDRLYDQVMNDEYSCCEEVEEEFEEKHDAVHRPMHYCSGDVETIDKIERIVEGLPAQAAYCLGNIIKYSNRAGLKDNTEQDLDKASAYAYRLIYGTWRDR